MTWHACIEAGGTKFVLGAVAGEREILARHRIATRTPGETIGEALAWFRAQTEERGPPAAFGIASFGPVTLDRAARDWGHVRRTPKPGWSGADIAGPFGRAFDCPVGFDTDVNGAALAESLWGAAQGADCAVYITVGTGIGGGVVVGGKPLHGLGHPEMGHARPPRHPHDSGFAGICAFHGDCFEGLASGPAVIARWGASLSELPAGHEAHEIIAHYLGHLAQTLVALIAPDRIVMGGGVLATPGLLDRVLATAAALDGGYSMDDVAARIVAPGLGENSGLLGAHALAHRARTG